ncbi:phage portal protein [Arthrobacter sp. UYCu723]
MLADEALRLVHHIHARIVGRRSEIDKYERYYLGDQNLTYATAEWLKANAARYSQFSDNWCAPVVNAISERVEVTGIKFRDSGDKADGLWDDWLRNEMEMQSSQGFLTSFNAKRSFVIVWGSDDDEPVMSWEHPSNVEIEYEWWNGRRRKAALKTWVDGNTEYATLYAPDEVFKYSREMGRAANEREAQSKQERADDNEGGWLPLEVHGESWPLPNPLGVVPVVEVPNRPILRGEPVSEVAQVIPLQDAINILWAYAMYAGDYASMPARVLLNVNPPMRKILDKDGKHIGDSPVTMKELNESRFAVFNGGVGNDAKIDSWPAAKLDVFTDVIELAVGHIAAQTRTPPHYLVSNKGLSNLAADALKAAEIGLVKKTQEFQKFATPAVREVFRLMALVKGDKGLAEQVRLAKVVWQNPEMRSEAQLADALVKKKTIGYPMEYLMELDGLGPTEINRVKDMIRDEQDAAQEDAMKAAAEFEQSGGNSVSAPVGPVAPGQQAHGGSGAAVA